MSSNIKRTYKVTQKVNGSRLYRPWKEWSEGDIIIGKYSGSSVDNYDKTNFHIDVEDAQFKVRGEAQKFIGKAIGLNSMGMLNKAMEKVPVGAIVQIEYTGSNVLEKGKYAGKESHTCAVAILEVESSGSDDVDL